MINRLKQGNLKCYFLDELPIFITFQNNFQHLSCKIHYYFNNAVITFLDHIPKDVKVEDEVSSLRSRLRQTFQEKVLVIKDKY